jgi:hypothetical protein
VNPLAVGDRAARREQADVNEAVGDRSGALHLMVELEGFLGLAVLGMALDEEAPRESIGRGEEREQQRGMVEEAALAVHAEQEVGDEGARGGGGIDATFHDAVVQDLRIHGGSLPAEDAEAADVAISASVAAMAGIFAASARDSAAAGGASSSMAGDGDGDGGDGDGSSVPVHIYVVASGFCGRFLL